jgi:hypothetical protein
MNKLVPYGFDSARNIFIERRMARLENRRVVLLPPNKYFRWVYLPNVKDGMNRNFNLRRLQYSAVGEGDPRTGRRTEFRYSVHCL